MNSGAHTDLEAIGTLARALGQYQQNAFDAEHRASAHLTQEMQRIAEVVRCRRVECENAEKALKSCRDAGSGDCSGAARAAAKARSKLEHGENALRTIEAADTPLRAACLRLRSEVSEGVRRAGVVLREASSDAAEYLHVKGSQATSGSNGETRRNTGAAGVTFVPLSQIDTSDRSIGSEDFGKGYSPADLTWAYHALHEVVLPAVDRGDGVDYLQKRDASEGLSGTRSYTDTYLGFLGPDNAIRLNRAGDRYQVANGYHRIWVARSMGLDSIPARVVE